MKTTALILITLLSPFFLVSCSKDDDNSTYKDSYTSTDLEIMHNNDGKIWKLDAHYDDYDANILAENNGCYTDEQFFFKKNNGEIVVTTGDLNCFTDSQNEEITTASYRFYEETGFVFLTLSKTVELPDITKNVFFTLQLVELQENLMIFAGGEKGNYRKTLVFKK